MLNNESSLRLNILRFPLIVGVVFIHAYETNVGLASSIVGVSQNSFLTEFVRNLISQGIARIAVPLFFLMSGYLFFAGVVWSKEKYAEKIKSRIKTLLIPFLFWNIATLILIALAQSLPLTQVYFSGKNALIASYSSFDYLSAIFGIDRSPISYQFWFIRDLMLLVLLAPIIFYLNKKLSFPFLCLLFIAWFISIWPIYAPSVEATLFFSTGCFLALTKKSLFSFDKYGKIITTVYALILIVDILFIKSDINPYLHKAGVILGVLAMLFATKLVVKSTILKQICLSLCKYSFFVYAAHEPLLTISRKVVYKIVQPSSTFLVLSLYFIIPTIVILLLILAHRILFGIFPKFTVTISGGR